jgi:hypothetical protein
MRFASLVVLCGAAALSAGEPSPADRALWSAGAPLLLSVIDELLDAPCDSGYVQYLKNKPEAHAGQDMLARGVNAEEANRSLRLKRLEAQLDWSFSR